MIDRMSDASRIVDKLKNKDLLSRKECPNDRRNVDILITEKGLELLQSLDDMGEKFEHVFSTLNDDEISKLNELLDKLRG